MASPELEAASFLLNEAENSEYCDGTSLAYQLGPAEARFVMDADGKRFRVTVEDITETEDSDAGQTAADNLSQAGLIEAARNAEALNNQGQDLPQIEQFHGDDPDFPISDWQAEVTSGDTQLAYIDWRADKKWQAEWDRRHGIEP